MGEGVVCVSWKDHTSELASVYKHLLENNFLVDCTLSAEGQSLKAHRLVLSACSPYFEMLFHQETGTHPFLILLDASFETLKAVIDFVYQGETHILERNVKAFLALAWSLQIKGLNSFFKDDNKLMCSTTENNLQGPPEGDQDTSEVQSLSASNRNNSENVSQLRPLQSKGYSVERTISSVPLDKFSARCEKVRPSQDHPRSLGCDGPVDPEITLKCEPVFEEFSETGSEILDNNNSNEPMSGTFASDGETSSVFVDQRVDQFQSCRGSSLGNTESSVMPPLQQQLVQLSGLVSSGRDGAEGDRPSLPVILVPKSKQADDKECDEPMDDTGMSGNYTNETDVGTKPACDEKSPDQYSRSGDCPAGSDMTSLPRLWRGAAPQSKTSSSQSESQRRKISREPVTRNVNPKPSASTSNVHKPRKWRIRPAAVNCSVCGTTFSKPGNLAAHMRTHTGERPYICKVCGEAYSHNQTLVNHMRSHTGENPCRCDVCGDAFASQNLLDVHKRRHAGERPYRCEVCGNEFAQRSSLIVHMRSHGAEWRSYRCDVCGKAFPRSDSLAEHKRLHTRERPPLCDISGS